MKAKKKRKTKAKKPHVVGRITPGPEITRPLVLPPVADEHVIVVVEKSTWQRICEWMEW